MATAVSPEVEATEEKAAVTQPPEDRQAFVQLETFCFSNNTKPFFINSSKEPK